MIDRYADPQINQIFTNRNRLKLWADIELAVAQVQEETGTIPAGTAQKLADSNPTLERTDRHEIEVEQERTRHDIVGFLRVWQGKAKPDAGQWLHYGLTSSDITDTALALQLKDATRRVEELAADLHNALLYQEAKAGQVERIGRTHGQWAVPTTFGHQLAVWQGALVRTRVALVRSEFIGKISGPVGIREHPGFANGVESKVLSRLGLTHLAECGQAAPRDYIAYWAACLVNLLGVCEQIALEVRHSARPEVSELYEPFGPEQVGSSSMRYKRNPITCEKICGLVRLARGYLAPVFENAALWGERDISHSSVERIVLPDLSHIAAHVLAETTRVVLGLRVDVTATQINLGHAATRVSSSDGQYHPDGSPTLAPKQTN